MKPDPNVFIEAAEHIFSGRMAYVCCVLSAVQGLGWWECNSAAHLFFEAWFKPKRLPSTHRSYGWYGNPYLHRGMCLHPQRQEARILALLLCVEILETES